MRLITLLAVCIAAVAAESQVQDQPISRIVGGTLTTIDRWPAQANVMFDNGSSFSQSCGGTIINNRSVLSAAHCARRPGVNHPASRFRLRLGSTWANSGGQTFNVAQLIIHSNYNVHNYDSDIMIMRSANSFVYSNNLQRANVASSNYNLPDNSVVWVTGWGHIQQGGPGSNQLRQVQVWTINQNTCAQRYAAHNQLVNANMLCTGWLDVGGRDACQGDSGGPVFHNNNIVGVTSWGRGCAQARYPGVNVRVSRFTSWITSNA